MLHGSPSISEIQDYVIQVYKEVNWCNKNYLFSAQADFNNILMNLFKKMRRSTLFVSKYMFNSPLDLKLLSLEHDRLSTKTLPSFQGIKQQVIQQIIFILVEMMNSPDMFSQIIFQYFQKKQHHEHLSMFAHCTFPAIYGYFVIPDIIHLAADFINRLISCNDDDVFMHFVLAFFENSPLFLHHLFSLYSELSLHSNNNPVKSFNCFIQALDKACYFLTEYHRSIAEKIYKMGYRVFNKIFVDNFLIPQFRNKYSHDAILEIFDFISYYDGTAPFKVLAKTFFKKRNFYSNEITLYGGLQGLRINCYPFLTTGYEIGLFCKIVSQNEKKAKSLKILNNCDPEAFKTFITFQLSIYPNSMKEIPHEKYSIFHPYKKANFKKENSEYRRVYNILKSRLEKENIPHISLFIDEEYDEFSSNKNFIHRIKSMNKMKNLKEFNKYALTIIANECAIKSNDLMATISLKSSIQCLKRLIDSAETFFYNRNFCFDNLENDDFQALSNINKCSPLENSSFHLNGEVYKIFSSYNEFSLPDFSYLVILKENIVRILQSEANNKIIKLAAYFSQIDALADYLGNGCEDSKEIYFFKLLYILAGDWTNLFDTFCFYFKNVDIQIKSDHYFGSNIKSSWNLCRMSFAKSLIKQSPVIKDFYYEVNDS